MKTALNFNSRGNEKIKLQGTYNFQILGNKTLIIADYEYAKIFGFATLNIKLWLKDDNVLYQFRASD